MILTVNQIETIIDIIRKNTTIFIGQQIGFNNLSTIDKLFLKHMKVNPNDFKSLSKIKQAYYFGIITKTLGKTKSKKLTFKEFLKFFEEQSQLPLSAVEQGALEYLENRAYNDLSGLGNKMANSFSNRILIASKNQKIDTKELVKEKTIQAVKESKSQQWLASELRNITKDYSRDFDRISDFLLHEAYDTGRAYAILEEHGASAQVYKDVYLGACDNCIDAYLTGEIGSEPKLFTVSELISNGNNIGRTAKESLPVIGPHHPYCRCTISYRPNGYLWNSSTKAFDIIPRNTQGVKRKSSVKVTITKT